MGFWSWLKDKLTDAGAFISDSIDTIHSYFESTDKERSEQELYIINLPQWVIDGMPEPYKTMYNNVKAMANNRANRTNTIFNNALNGIKSWWDNFSSDVSDVTNALFVSIEGAYDRLGNWWAEFSEDITQTVKGITDWISEIDNWFKTKMLDMSTDIINELNDWIDNIFDMDEDGQNDIIEEVEGWLT